MIVSDQPVIFGDKVIAAVSSQLDGNMSFSKGDQSETVQNRINFLNKNNLDYQHATLVQVTYDDIKDFTRYKILQDFHKAEGMLKPTSTIMTDALVVTEPGHALFLPLADCVGAIIYDAKQHILMVSHLGRHSTEQQGAAKSIMYLVDQFHSNIKDIKIWLSPAVGEETYPIKSLNNTGLHEAITTQLLAVNIPRSNIEISSIDTATDKNYFSHSQFLAGRRDKDGRFAIVAMMSE